MKVYISGLIENNTDEVNAEKDLIKSGHTPISPLKLHKGKPVNLSFRLEQLSKCDAIYLLPGWINSPESRAEKFFAEVTDKQVMFQSRDEADKYQSDKFDQSVFRIAGVIHEVTGKSLKDYANGPRSLTNYYCRILFAVHCKKAGIEPEDISNRFINRSPSSMVRCLKKYPDELVNAKFRSLADRVNKLLYPETYQADTCKR